jgi:hypothetical protein
LLDIKDHRRYEAAGFKSWGAYCSSGRIDYAKTQTDKYIRASELRPKLGTTVPEFSVRQMIELCKCETDRDAKRVAKKSIALAKKTGERVTAKLIAQVRDGKDETGVTEKRQDAALQSASLDSHLEELAGILVNWRFSLEQIDLQQWEAVAAETLTRVRNEAMALTAFLRC